MAKLDPVKIRYIIRQKEQGRSTKDISLEMKVCGRWVQKLYRRYLDTRKIPVLGKPGRPRAVIIEQLRQVVAECFQEYQIGAVGIEKALDCNLGVHNTIRNEGIMTWPRNNPSLGNVHGSATSAHIPIMAHRLQAAR